MGGYAIALLPYDGKDILCTIPYSDLQASEKTAGIKRPYSIIEILQENFKEDFHKPVSIYVEETPQAFSHREGFDVAAGTEGTLRYECLSTRVLRVESVLL